MPLLKIETNKTFNDSQVEQLVKKSSEHIAILLNKPEKWVMISLNHSIPMSYSGTSEPCAFISLKSIGLDLDITADLSNSICTLIEEDFGISSDRIYIDFVKLEKKEFGWNKSTF